MIGRTSGTLALATALALSGCKQRDTDTRPTATSTPTPATSESSDALGIAEGGSSIMRPDIETAPVLPERLEPLEMVISFPDGGAQLGPDAQTKLQAALDSEQMAQGGPVTLRGHSDSGGDGAINLRVSKRRAEAVRDFLIGKGLAKARVTVIAMGEQNPIANNALSDGTPDEAGRAQNRRVDLIVSVPPAKAAPQEEDTPTAIEALTDKGEG